MKVQIKFKLGNEVFWSSRDDGNAEALINGAKSQWPNVVVLKIEKVA